MLDTVVEFLNPFSFVDNAKCLLFPEPTKKKKKSTKSTKKSTKSTKKSTKSTKKSTKTATTESKTKSANKKNKKSTTIKKGRSGTRSSSTKNKKSAETLKDFKTAKGKKFFKMYKEHEKKGDKRRAACYLMNARKNG